MMVQAIHPLQIPTDIIDEIQDNPHHIVLFYEEPEYAKMIEFRFLKNGLLKGEDCLYITGEDTGEIVVKMLAFGISFQYFKTRQLRVIQIKERKGSRENIISSCRVDVKRIMSEIKNSFRIVARIVPNVNTREGISAELEMEQLANNIFDKYNGSIMCPYNISEIEPKERKTWIERLHNEHHIAIYIPKKGLANVFYNQ